LGER